MTTNRSNLSSLSPKRVKRIREQGYFHQSESELASLAFGNRFAYRLCTTLLIPGVVLADIPVLSLMMAIAFLGVVLPYHPFDYIYNHVLSERMGKPQLPPRSKQLKFACTVATLWIATTIFMFYAGQMVAAYVLGGMLIAVALLVSTIDLCIPSVIYNTLFERRREKSYIK